MSVSGSRAGAEINLEEFERRLRTAGALPMDVDDPLLELARLVESAQSAPMIAAAVATPTGGEEARRLEREALHPALQEVPDTHGEVPAEGLPAEDEGPQPASFDDFDAGDGLRTEPLSNRRAIAWTVKVAALSVAGVAMIGSVFALKGGVPGMPKQPPFIAAPQGPVKVLPPTGETVSASNDAGASLLRDSAKPPQVKVVASEEQPVDLNALASTVPPAPAPGDPAASADVSLGAAVKATADAPVVVTSPSPPPPPSQFPDPKPVRTVSLRPDGTPIPAPAPASAAAGDAAPAAEAPKPPAKPAPKAAVDAAANAQASTPRVELPTKLSGKSSARVAVAKTDTTALGAAAEARRAPLPVGASVVKPEKAAKALKAAQPGAEAAAPAPQVATAASAAPASPAAPVQQPDNPILHALGSLVGSDAAPAAPAAPAEPPIDSAAATKSSGWAVQLGAPKSEAEANSDAAKFNAKYASALKGSSVGVLKAAVNGETIYRLRVVGLSKAEAAALCARLKGDGSACFIAR